MDIYCPNCERRIPQGLEKCPKCGCILKAKTGRKVRWWQRDADPQDMIYQEIGWLRILGAVAFIVGVFGVVWGMISGAKTVAIGLEMIVVGLFLRAFGGIWATLERIARK